MKYLYVSLPITGHPYEDVRERCRKAKELYTTEERMVLTPVDIIRDQSTAYNSCIGRCVEVLMDCNEAVFLDGWRDSKGCQVEYTVCSLYGIKIIIDNNGI